MRLRSITGRLVNRNVSKYLIDWSKKSRSKIQFKTKQFLKEYWKNHIVYEEFPVYGTRLKVDILNATKKIAVEVNGKQHSSFNKFLHDGSRQKFLQSIKRDCKKFDWLESNDFEVIEIEEDEVPLLSCQLIEAKCGVKI
jgi:hypothetical protein